MISIVIGKPGSGKSYHITRYIVDYLTKLAKKKESKRVIYTNISLNLPNLQKYFDERKIKIDVSRFVRLLGEDDLRFRGDLLEEGDVKEEKRGARKYRVIAPGSQAFFWNRFPDDALIIIDEVQKYIGSVKEYGESENQSLVEYFSLHRHKKHDWIFLTQALLSLSLVVRRVSERVQEVFNSKFMTLPFPISIPFRDIQILLRGFGIQNQVYRVRDGLLENSYKVVYEGPIEVVPMTREIFDLYQTHTLKKDDDDSGTDSELPFDLGPGAWWRAVKWFIGKHWLHLTLKLAVIVLAFKLIFSALDVLASQEKMSKFLGLDKFLKQNEIQAKAGGNNASVHVVPLPGFNDSQDNSAISEDEAIEEPIIEKEKIIITSSALLINSKPFEVGQLTEKGRIARFNAREGVIYENPADVYLRDARYVYQCGRWVQYIKSQRSIDE